MVRDAPRILLLLAAFGCDSRAELLADRAESLLFEREYEEAARAYEAVLIECGERRDPDVLALRRAALLRLGQIRQHFGSDPRASLRAYRAIVRLDPKPDEEFEVRLLAARLLRDRLYDPAGAVAELAALVEAFPDHRDRPQLDLELAQAAFRAGRWEVVLRHTQRVVGAGTGVSPGDRIEAAMLLASVHEVEHRLPEALAVYESILKMDLDAPLVARVRFEIAHCHERIGDLDRALAGYEEARMGAHDPGLVEARISRVKAELNARK